MIASINDTSQDESFASESSTSKLSLTFQARLIQNSFANGVGHSPISRKQDHISYWRHRFPSKEYSLFLPLSLSIPTRTHTA